MYSVQKIDSIAVGTHQELFEEIQILIEKDPRPYELIAREANCSVTAVRNWCLGITRKPQMLTICKLSRAYNRKLVLAKKRY